MQNAPRWIVEERREKPRPDLRTLFRRAQPPLAVVGAITLFVLLVEWLRWLVQLFLFLLPYLMLAGVALGAWFSLRSKLLRSRRPGTFPQRRN